MRNSHMYVELTESESTTEDTDFTKNLIFAVKFGNAIAGHYTGTVTLSLAAEPKEIVTPTTPIYEWGKLEYMQQMTPEACAQATKATSSNYTDVQKILKDSRDDNTYIVRKLDDGKCWMTQNLRIVNKKIDSTDSNLAEGATYTIPASSSPWNDTSATTNKVHYAGNTTNGANYTWYTATASTQGSSYSICPRGWKLPTISEYEALKAKGTTKVDNISGDNFDGYNIGGALFPTAGVVSSGSLRNVGSEGYYWSSTAVGPDNACHLSFSSSNVNTSNYYRFSGFSIRCIAQ